MKKSLILITVVTVLAVMVAAIWIGSGDRIVQSDSDTPTVGATIFPLYDIARNVAGDAVNVQLLLPVGASPHTYDPTPSLLRDLQGASVIYTIGSGMDDWSKTISDGIAAASVSVDQGIALREGTEDDEHIDPHYWLAFENAALIAQTIADDLSARYPESTDLFEENAQMYLAQLQMAEQEAHRIITDEVENPYLITLHDAWYYFAESFDLEIAGTFEPTAGREPTPQYLIELTEGIQRAGGNIVYSEPQLSTESIESFARDNNLTIVILDPLGGTDKTPTYIDMMLSNVRLIADNQ